MAALYKPLGDEERGCLHDMARAMFLDGECYAFAVALSRGLGRPMVGLMRGDEIRHATVYMISHLLHDVRGIFSQEDPKLGEPFGMSPPYTLRTITEGDLLAVRPVHERTIATAARFAEAIWPNLPWTNSRARRAAAFAEELEALSRKHKFWIRAPYPAAMPILCDGMDDEAGYTLQHTCDASSFTIDRRL